MQIVQMLAPQEKWEIKCPYSMKPEYVTIHDTANRASALAEISYMIGNNNDTSYHFAVDDKQAIQGLPLSRNAWHCGDGSRGTGNRQSIGIEMCYSLLPADDPKRQASVENGAKLAALVLKENGWGIDRLRKHEDWSGKYCPHNILDNVGWETFKGKVQYHLDATATPTVDEWVQHGDGRWWYRFASGGYAKNEWLKVGDKYFYFDEEGYMVTGWRSINGHWYYMNENGEMARGWKLVDGDWYYLEESGAMYTGWLKDKEKYYYLAINKGGRMLKGVQSIGNHVYVFEKSGALVTNKTVVLTTNENGELSYE